MHQSRGYSHHADATVECPHGCGRRHRTGTSVTAQPDGTVSVMFKSKLTGRWGKIVVPAEQIRWSDEHPMKTETEEG